MIDIDHLYDIVSKETPSTSELEKIVDEVDNGTSFTNSSFSSTDLYIKIAKSKNVTDKIIEKMVQSQFDNHRVNKNLKFILDNLSKTAFDKIFEESKTSIGGKYLKLVLSKHSDTEQIEWVWNKALKKPDKNVSKAWIQNLKRELYRHPNFPTKIMNRQLRNEDSLLNIALNPNLSGKALEEVATWAKVQRHDGMFENLTRNKGLDWKVISKVVDMKEQLKIAFGTGGFLKASFRRKAAIFEFFRRPDTSDTALAVMYKLTGEEEFLPQSAKDIFLF